MRAVRIATGDSRLARARAAWVTQRLEALGHACETATLTAPGDRERIPFAEMQGPNFFTEAARRALHEGRADLAVHAHQDLPSTPSPGLEIAAVPARADARDVLLARPSAYAPDADALPLRLGARVGAGSVRRQRQLLHHRPDLDIRDPPGNVPSRIERLRTGDVDALVLAAADLERLGLSVIELATGDLEVTPLDPAAFVPAPAQGALALEIRRDHAELARLLTDLHDPRGYRAVAAERGLQAMLPGECQPALGAHATVSDNLVVLVAWYQGRRVQVEYPSSEGAAMLAFEALGRPAACEPEAS